MSTPDVTTTTTTALVTGASRGFGRAIAVALHHAGAHVVGLSRSADRLADLGDELGDRFTPVVGDAADPVTAGLLLAQYRPTTVVLNAGATPLMRPIQQQTWQSFNRPWEVDAQQAFHWIREALILPLDPGSTVIAMSSGAALNGSPLSGGYAAAKVAVRLVAGYAADESERAGLGIRFISVLPRLTPATDTGAVAVAAYAGREGMDVAAFLDQFGPTLTPGEVGHAITDLVVSTKYGSGGYLLTPAGLAVVP
jgi:NAD(P)-dependent dehydrogenase (short-subunit alcohol dehydrogenase family)